MCFEDQSAFQEEKRVRNKVIKEIIKIPHTIFEEELDDLVLIYVYNLGI